MDTFEAKYGERLTRVMRVLYELRKLASLCARKSVIKQIKVAKVKENRNLMSKLSATNNIGRIDELHLQVNRDLAEIGKINEFLGQNTMAMMRERERDLEQLANQKLNTTTAALIKDYFHAYEKALSIDMEIEIKMVEAEQIAKQKAEEKALEARMVELEKIETAKLINKSIHYHQDKEQELNWLRVARQNENTIDNRLIIDEDIADQEEVFEDNVIAFRKQYEFKKKEQLDRSFINQYKLSNQGNLRKVKTVPYEISKSSSFQFEQMKESIDYSSAQKPGTSKSFSRESSIQSEEKSIQDTINSYSDRFFSGQNSFEEEDSNTNESTEDSNESAPKKTWLERFEEERSKQMPSPETENKCSSSKSKSTIVITKLNNKTKFEKDCITISDSFSSIESLEPTQLLYPKHLERELLGSQYGNLDTYSTCMSSSKRDQSKRMKNSDSIVEIYPKTGDDDFFDYMKSNLKTHACDVVDITNEEDEPTLEEIMTRKPKTYRRVKARQSDSESE